MFFKLVKYAENWLSVYHAKVKAKELILKDVFDYTAEDLKFWEEYRWFDAPNTLKGEYYPFMGNKLSGLTKFIDILVSKYELNSFKDIAFRHQVVIRGSKKYLYIMPVNFNERDREYPLDFTPLKIAIKIKGQKIVYQLLSDVYADDKERKNILAYKPKYEWKKKDHEFIKNYKWEDRLNSVYGDFMPFPSSPLRSLNRLINNLYAQNKIFKNHSGGLAALTKADFNKIKVGMSLETEPKSDQFFLVMYLYDEDGQEIYDDTLPQKFLITPDYAGIYKVIKYEQAEESFVDVKTKVTEIFKKGYAQLTEKSMEFLDSYDYDLEVESKDGIIYLLNYNPCYLLAAWLKQYQKNGKIKEFKGTKLRVQGRPDDQAEKLALDVYLLNKKGVLVDDVLNPFSLYITEQNGMLSYSHATDANYDHWSHLKYIFQKDIKEISVKEEKFANSYKPWRREIFSDGFTGYVTVFNQRTEKIFGSITRGLREAGAIGGNLVGCWVEFQPLIDRKSGKKQLQAIVLDKEGRKIGYEYNLIKLDVEYDEKKGLYVVPAADNYNSAREKALKLFWKDNDKLSAEECDYVNSYSFVENYQYEIRVFEKLRLRVSRQILEYFKTKGFAPEDLRLQFRPDVFLANNRKFINIDFLDPSGQRILSPELPSLKYEVPVDGSTLSPAADAFFPIKEFYASLAVSPFDQISEKTAQAVNNFSGFTEEFNPNYFAPLAGVAFRPLTGLLKKFVEEGYLDQTEGTNLSYKLVLDLESRKKSVFITILDKQGQKIDVFYNPIVLNINNGPAGKDIIYEIDSNYTQDKTSYINYLLWLTDLSAKQIEFLNQQTWVQKLNMQEEHFTIGNNLVLPDFQSKLRKQFNLAADKNYYVQIKPDHDYPKNSEQAANKVFFIAVFQSNRLQKKIKNLKIIKDAKNYNYYVEEDVIFIA
jgi:hypothetical protein